MELKEKVKELLLSHNLLEEGEKVIVGFSGGADSLTLLDILKELAYPVHAFHLNHLLRGEESFRDEEKVREYCHEKGIPLTVVRKDVRRLKKKGESLEEAGRRIRWEELKKLARALKVNKVALAHHLDDQVETVIFRLLRGTGPGGLGGMRIRSYFSPGIWVIRPLLPFPRQEIIRYVREKRLQPTEDSTNFDLRFPRNRIRHRIIPLLEEINPRFREKVYTLSLLLQEDEDFFQEKVRKMVEKWEKGGEFIFPLEEFKNLPFSLKFRVLREMLIRMGEEEVNLSRLQEIEKELSSPRPNIIISGKNLEIRKEYQRVIFSPPSGGKFSYYYTLNPPGEIEIPEAGVRIISSFLSHASIPAPPTEAYLDTRDLSFPLTIRNRKPGDRFHPLGSPGIKKLKDFFMEKKVPLKERDRIPLVISGKDIVWVAGWEIDHRYRVREDTDKILHLRMEKIAL